MQLQSWRELGLVLAFGVSVATPGISIAANDNAPIARIKLTDNEMSCEQIYAEANEMDRILAASKSSQSNSQNAAVAADTAAAVAPVANALGGFTPFGGLFGQAAGRAASQVAANKAVSSGERARQAAARKDTLTSLFLNKQCKVSTLRAQSGTPTENPAGASTEAQPATVTGTQPAAQETTQTVAQPGVQPAAATGSATGAATGTTQGQATDSTTAAVSAPAQQSAQE